MRDLMVEYCARLGMEVRPYLCVVGCKIHGSFSGYFLLICLAGLVEAVAMALGIY